MGDSAPGDRELHRRGPGDLVIFVDTGVFMYAVGRRHRHREDSRRFFAECLRDSKPLATSAQVCQELLHAYLPVKRDDTLEAALSLVEGTVGHIWSIEAEDVRLARSLLPRHSDLTPRSLLHLATCIRREVQEVQTFDPELARAFTER